MKVDDKKEYTGYSRWANKTMVVGEVNLGVSIVVSATQTIADHKTLKNKENSHEFIQII